MSEHTVFPASAWIGFVVTIIVSEVATKYSNEFKTFPSEENEYLVEAKLRLDQLDSNTQFLGSGCRLVAAVVILPPAVILLIVGMNICISLVAGLTILGMFAVSLAAGACVAILVFISRISNGGLTTGKNATFRQLF